MSYEKKKKQLFDSLDAAEKSLHGSCLEQKNEDYGSVNRYSFKKDDRDRSTERYKRKDSIFKRPELPINKCLRARQCPDHEKNPHRYKHYSLADVTDTSDRMNTSAAFSFLREMEDRKSREEARANQEATSENKKIVFKNSIKLRQKHDNETSDHIEKREKVIGNKFVMKEYVIGEKRQKIGKKLPRTSSTASSAKQLKLSHLDDDQEHDEEEKD